MATRTAATNVLAFPTPKKFTWDDPDKSLIQATQTPVPAFPRKLFGPAWNQWVEAVAASKNAPYDYVAASLLTVAGALIGNAREIKMEGWKEPPILWTVLVGNPSSGKSPAMDPFSEIIEALEGEMRDAQDDDDDNGLSAIHVDDATAQAAAQIAASNPKGLLLMRDELSGWWEKFGQYGGDAFWINAFGARPGLVHRKNKPPLRIPRLAISVLGGSQPDTLRSFLTAKQNKGFAAQWLYVCPPPVGTFRIGKAADTSWAEACLRALRELPLVNGRPVAVPLARHAKQRFEAWVASKHEEAKGDEEGVWGQWLGKQGGVALRLALIIEHLWWAANPHRDQDGPTVVSQSALSAATNFIDGYAGPMTVVALNNAVRPASEQDAKTLLALLRRRPIEQFNARLVGRGSNGPAGRLATPAVMASACDVLEAAHLIRFAGVRAGNHKGRKTNDYEANPVLFGSEFQR